MVRWFYADAATAPVHERDIAAVAVRAMCGDGHDSREYVLTGPASLTQREQVQIIGANWFSTAQGQELAHMVETGTLNLSYLEHERFPLADVNRAISGLEDRRGGFTNYVVIP